MPITCSVVRDVPLSVQYKIGDTTIATTSYLIGSSAPRYPDLESAVAAVKAGGLSAKEPVTKAIVTREIDY